MKLYACGHCKQPLYFENNTCLNCGHVVGFEAISLSMIALEPDKTPAQPVTQTKPPQPSLQPASKPQQPLPSPLQEKSASPGQQSPLPIWFNIADKLQRYRFCANSVYGACNWLISPDHPSPFCQACELNRIIPALSSPENLGRWSRIEIAKHRLIYSLLRLRLPVRAKEEPEEKPTEEGLAFDFMADLSPTERVMTGHNHGVITLNIEEADEAERVRNKLDLGEKYRTLQGHFRHEIGHYYWDLLIKDKPALVSFRTLFGDEQKDYAESLKMYYETGAPADWAERFISPYASSHPWEDWAETWSHYMHLMDTLETAWSFGIIIRPREKAPRTDVNSDPYEMKDFNRVLESWLPLTFAVNSLNRSMGNSDFYPFVISPAVMNKLSYIHDICRVP